MFELPVAETFLGIQRGFSRVKDVASTLKPNWERPAKMQKLCPTVTSVTQ